MRVGCELDAVLRLAGARSRSYCRAGAGGDVLSLKVARARARANRWAATRPQRRRRRFAAVSSRRRPPGECVQAVEVRLVGGDRRGGRHRGAGRLPSTRRGLREQSDVDQRLARARQIKGARCVDVVDLLLLRALDLGERIGTRPAELRSLRSTRTAAGRR